MNLENEDKLQKNKLYTSAERKQKLPSEVIKDAKNWCALRVIFILVVTIVVLQNDVHIIFID